MTPSLERAKYTYVLAAEPLAALPGRQRFGPLTLSYSADMDCLSAQAQQREVLVLGRCADARGQLAASDVADFLLGNSADIESLCPLTDRLAGRFVVLYRDGRGLFALTDAAATLQINYAAQGRTALSSSEQVLANHLGLPASDAAAAIWRGAAPSVRFMPHGVTMHDGIRFLQPNHYLGPGGPVRYFPRGWREPPLSAAEAADRIVPLVRCAVRALSADQPLISGLTAGYDSRLVYAFLREAVEAPFCYTYINPGFTERTADLAVPAQLARRFHIRYEQVAREPAPAPFRDALRALAGPWTPDAHVNAAYAYIRAGFQDRTYVGGALIDQIGRDHVADGLSHRGKGEAFIRAVARNSEPAAWPHIGHWCAEAGEDPGSASLVDLFAWECLCARWGTNPPLVHALAGNGYLNIFNCRDVLKAMLRVPSRARFERKLHEAMYARLAPELLQIPFNPPRTLRGRLQRTRPYTYLANVAGFALRSRRYRPN